MSLTSFLSIQLTEMNGKMISGKPLYVAFAQRKEDRKAMLQVYSSNQLSLHYVSIKCEIRVPVFTIDCYKCLL